MGEENWKQNKTTLCVWKYFRNIFICVSNKSPFAITVIRHTETIDSLCGFSKNQKRYIPILLSTPHILYFMHLSAIYCFPFKPSLFFSLSIASLFCVSSNWCHIGDLPVFVDRLMHCSTVIVMWDRHFKHYNCRKGKENSYTQMLTMIWRLYLQYCIHLLPMLIKQRC